MKSNPKKHSLFSCNILKFFLDLFLVTFNGICFILSLKVLPPAWHIRNYYVYVRHYLMNKRPIPPPSPGSITIFQPTIWSTTTPFGEIDSNGHKSNSTYFTDLDLARNNHIWSMFRTGLRLWSQDSPPIFPRPGAAVFASLGGVTCSFKKAIPPGQKLDILTRTVTWDHKWVYLQSQFVARSAFKPSAFSDQPWYNVSREIGGKPESHNSDKETTLRAHEENPTGGHEPKPTVFAVSFQRIVFKQGRQTLPPSQIMIDSGLLPPHFTSASSSSGFGQGETSSGIIGPEAAIGTVEHTIEEQRRNALHLVQYFGVLEEGVSLCQEDEVAFSTH